MAKINETNYGQMLQETISVIGAVSVFLGSNRVENRIELACLNQAMKQIQGALRAQQVKAMKAKTNRYQKRQEQSHKRDETNT